MTTAHASVLLHELPEPLQLRNGTPVAVTIESWYEPSEPTSFVAKLEPIMAHGEGSTVAEALEDLGQGLLRVAEEILLRGEAHEEVTSLMRAGWSQLLQVVDPASLDVLHQRIRAAARRVPRLPR